MIRFPAAALLAISLLPCSAQPEAQLPPGVPGFIAQPPPPWMGVDLIKPDAIVAAQIKGLPANVGFIVNAVDPGGPGELAGLHPLDVIWRMGDQLLINESQLGVLLRLQKVGDVVRFSAFRAGEPLEISLTLGQTPDSQATLRREVADNAVLPTDRSPMRVVNMAEKTASFENADGRVAVTKLEQGYHVLIRGVEDNASFEMACIGEEDFEKIPEAWKGKVFALRRGLDQALQGGGIYAPTLRQPRPRVIPAPVQTAPKS